MILVIGGCFQGKTAYAREYFSQKGFSIEEKDIADGRSCAPEAIYEKPMVTHFHEYIRRHMEDDSTAEEFAERLFTENPDVLVVSNELGYGVVPVDKFDRAYRERTGRILCALAKRAREVHRVVCGIGTVIKG